MAYFVEVQNPFDRRFDRVTQSPEQTVWGWLCQKFPGFVRFNHPTVCCVNDEPILQDEWRSRKLKDGDIVSIIPVVGDPITLIVIAVAAAVVAAVAVTLALPTPQPKTPGNIPEPDSVFTLEGQYNQFRLGQPIEVCFGTVRRWPSYAAAVYNKYRNNEQFYYALFCIGQGEHQALDALLEDTQIANFEGAEFDFIEPGEDVNLFENNVVTSSEIGNIELFGPNESEYSGWVGPFVLNPAGTSTNRVELDFILPQGLYYSNNDGGLSSRQVSFEVQFQKVDDLGNSVGGWLAPDQFLRIETRKRKVTKGYKGKKAKAGSWKLKTVTWEPSDGLGQPGDVINIYSNKESGFNKTWVRKTYTLSQGYQDRTTTPLRFTEEFPLPENARWQVRARRTNDASNSHRVGDTLKWGGARAFLPNTTDFGGVSLFAFQARATNNLNDNSQQRVNVWVTRKLPLWDSETGWSDPMATRSIVAAFCEIFRARYGGGLADSMLNLTELWGTLEPFYDGRGEYFDYIFANKTTVLEAAKTVARAGRGVPMIVGTQLTIVRDGPASLPTALFGPHNIVKNTFEWEVSLYDDTEPDAIEIIYTDPETFQEESIVCGLDDDPVEPVRPKRVPLPGVTDRDIAYREGLYIRANQRHVREQVKFRTGLEGRIPRYGAFIGVAHDLPQWGQSGRLKSISGTTVTSLNKLEWAEGENHQIAFRDRYGNTVGPYSVTQGATSNVLILGAALPSNVLNSLIQDDNTGHPSLFLFGVTNDFYRQMKVTSIRNAGNDQVEVTAVNYSAIPHSFDGVSAPAKTSTSSVLSLPDVPTMSGITVEALPNTITDAIIKWEPVLGAKRYIIGQSFNEGVTWVQVGEVVTSFFYLPVTPGRLNVRVAATNQGTSLFKTWVGVVGLVRMIDDEENALTDDEGNVLYESES